MKQLRRARYGQEDEIRQMLLRALSSANLTREEAQQLIEGDEKPFRDVMSRVLRVDPKSVDLPRLEETLHLGRRFSQRARRDLEELGYEVVEMPPGVTLKSMEGSFVTKHVHPPLDRFDIFPTQRRQVAWKPEDPFVRVYSGQLSYYEKLIDGLFKEIDGHIFRDTEMGDRERAKAIVRRLKGRIKTVIPTAEDALWLRCNYHQALLPSKWSMYTRTVNTCGLDYLVVGEFRANSKVVVGASSDRFSVGGDVSVLHLVVPA